MTPSLAYYATHSPITEPGDSAALLAPVAADPARLCRIVQGVLVHIFWAEQYGLHLSERRRAEVQLRWVARQLARIQELDPQALDVERPPERRLVGNCRDFSVLLTALLRQQGIPARARCGFARYFLPDHYEDHWVCEYWNSALGRWVLVDAQLDALQRERLQITFDPLDVPREQFVVGGAAWELCRTGAADPATFGIFDMQGLWFVRGNLVRDVAALNKLELLPWDGWGLIEAADDDLRPDALAVQDDAAALARGDVPDWAGLRALYARAEGLRVPAVIHSYQSNVAHTVELAGV